MSDRVNDAELRRWFEMRQPRSGLVSSAYELLSTSRQARVSAVGALLDVFFSDTDFVKLLEDVGLSDTGISTLTGEDLAPESPLEEAYRRLCGLADRYR